MQSSNGEAWEITTEMNRRRLYEFLEVARDGDRASKICDSFILILIGLNVAAVILETVEGVSERYFFYFLGFEVFSVVIFSFEYFLRIWVCVEDPRYRHPVWGRLRYMVSFLAIIDLLAILPTFVYPPFVVYPENRTHTLLRMLRIMRMLKLARYSVALQLLFRVLNRAREELFMAFMVILILVVLMSGVMYYVEREAHQQIGSDAFASIPSAMYWGAITVSTVGYGDVTPLTSAGRFLSAVMSLLGIALFALPTGILSYEFMNELQSRRQRKSVCPHCGETIDHAHTRQTDTSA
jgi:voltage-gated potassium channel